MYKEYYHLSADPFRLTPNPGFVYAHQSYLRVHANMRHALEQGDGILVVTGRSGIGKTTLVESFLAELQPDNILTGTLGSTSVGGDDLLRMVAYTFGVDAQAVDKATLLHNLEALLTDQARALLIIDEAQNLSEAALEEVRLLSNMRARSRPLLQIFLLGQENLHKRLHLPAMEQLHQRLVVACTLEPLCLEETRNYVLHLLECAQWRGNPAIATETLVLIHRFSQGLPRYINKLCRRLLLRGAMEQRSQLDLDDIVPVIQAIQDEQLLPLIPAAQLKAGAALPPMRELLHTKGLPAERRLALTEEERAFIERHPAVTEAPPRREVATPASGAAASVSDSIPAGLGKWRLFGYGAAALVVLAGTYLLGEHNAGQPKVPVRSESIASGPEQESVEAPPAAAPVLIPANLPVVDDYLTGTLLTYSLESVHQAPSIAGPVPTAPEAQGTSEILEPITVEAIDFAVAAADDSEALTAQAEQDARDKKIGELLLLGEQAIASDRLRLPEDQSAWGFYKQVLELDPGNPAGERGLQQIAARYGELTIAQINKQQYDKAQLFITRGLGVVPGESKLLALQEEVDKGKAELLAVREAERLLASQASEAARDSATAEPEPESTGFFGALKKFFTGRKTPASPE